MAAKQTQSYTIRYAEKTDVPQILAMINELADYEKALSEVQATEEKLLATLSFASDPTNRGFAKTILISSPHDSHDVVAGMAMYFHNYSTWHAAPGIYLEDLFVRPAFRRAGFGKALLQALARECVATGCKRLEWSVLKWNEPSIRFYESEAIGARMMDEWAGMRVTGEKLDVLASRE